MKESIEAKVKEIIDYILSKNPKDISYNEYRILDAKLASIKYDEEQKEKNKKMFELMGSAFMVPSGTTLPDPVKED